MKLAEDRGIPVKSLKAGDVLRPDPSVIVPVYAPSPHYTGNDANEHSVVVEVIYGETEFLFTGDVEHESEEWMKHTYPDFVDTDVLKAGHHGSKTSSGAEFLRLLSPDRVVVSCAVRNKFGHPHPETVEKLFRQTEHIHYTALEGAVVLLSDGIKVESL
jgi:competence protein ComEC